jgi:hypothetical protein
VEQSVHTGLAPTAWPGVKIGNSDSVLQLEQCWIAGEVPLDRYDKGTRTERVQIRSMYSVELAQTGKIERTVI